MSGEDGLVVNRRGFVSSLVAGGLGGMILASGIEGSGSPALKTEAEVTFVALSTPEAI